MTNILNKGNILYKFNDFYIYFILFSFSLGLFKYCLFEVKKFICYNKFAIEIGGN